MKFALFSILLSVIYSSAKAIPYNDANYADVTTYGKDAFITPKGDCDFDLSAYTGGWFEIASAYSVGQTFELGCICPVAYYSLNKTDSSYFDITNSCIRNGQFWKMQGYASPAAVNSSGSYNVYLYGSNVPPTYSGNYVVLKVWYDEFDDYTYALVGGNNRNNWWFISRSPSNENDGETLKKALKILRRWNYDVDNYTKPIQKCIFLGGHDGVNLIESLS